jgi:pimeloyl-ACP methyl ester carboxylesterase
MAVAGLLLAGVLAWNPLNHLVFSIRLALSLQKVASGADGRDLAVEETRISRRMGTRECEAILYRPAKSRPTSAIVLVAGISELGCYHPRLVALSRFLADMGLLVITPDIRAFREFKISAEPIDQMLFWYNNVRTLKGSGEVRKIGLAGISFSGTLALMAAARPGIHDRVGFAVGIGSYYSLPRCAEDWFAAEPADTQDNYYPTRFYAKWLVMLSALNMISAPEDRLFLRDVLNSLLLQKKIPPPGPDLTPDGERWYKLATMRGGPPDRELAKKIEAYLLTHIYPPLDPEGALERLRCPVFLIHGASDDLIPPRESMELHRRIVRSCLLISPFLSHTHLTDAALPLKQKARSLFDALVFCYQFSRAIS